MNVLIVSSGDCLITAHHANIVISCWVWKCHHPLHHLWDQIYSKCLQGSEIGARVQGGEWWGVNAEENYRNENENKDFWGH